MSVQDALIASSVEETVLENCSPVSEYLLTVTCNKQKDSLHIAVLSRSELLYSDHSPRWPAEKRRAAAQTGGARPGPSRRAPYTLPRSFAATAGCATPTMSRMSRMPAPSWAMVRCLLPIHFHACLMQL